MKQFIFASFVMIFFSSCAVDHDLELKIENNSENRISDIRFYTTNEKESFYADGLSPGEEISKTLNIKNYDADGDYTFEYLGPDGEKTSSTGNYLEEDYIKNILTFRIVNGGVEVEKKIVQLKD